MTSLRAFLEPIADAFSRLGVPEPIVHWGHPLMMGIVIAAMGSFVAYTGWRSRLTEDKDVSLQSRAAHRKLAPWMFLFMALGYTGGVLSLVMQDQPIFESPHFWTGSLLIGLLATNGAISISGFGGNNPSLRMAHAYIGTVAVLLMVIHAALGLKLGLSI